MKAFGLDNAKKLLKHWPYVYCPTLGVLFVKNANPKVGDIVIFKKHIGIVSNYRNKKGITFVIHHAYPHQLYYEEDILEKRNDIIGHYRIS